MKIRPLQDRILVKRIEAEKKTPGGIYIPPTASEKPSEATVIAVGPGKLNDRGVFMEPRVKVGDKVLFGKYTGVEVKLGGEEHLIIAEGDILGVYED
jgi:chaperonin GroES